MEYDVDGMHGAIELPAGRHGGYNFPTENATYRVGQRVTVLHTGWAGLPTCRRPPRVLLPRCVLVVLLLLAFGARYRRVPEPSSP